MPKVRLDRTDLSVSRFGFGTSRLFSAGTRRKRLAILEAAADNGITHFDTSPYYGFGIAESDLGLVLARWPEATVATKVGIYAPGGAGQPPWSVLARKAGGKVFSTLSRRRVDWSIGRAQRSLDESLRRLRREYVDLLLLHDPPWPLPQTDEWLRWAESARHRARALGTAGYARSVGPYVSENGPFAQVIQCEDGLEASAADAVRRAGRPLQITFGYVSAAMGRAGFDAAEVLARALRRNSSGCVLVSTTDERRVPLFSQIASRESMMDVAGDLS